MIVPPHHGDGNDAEEEVGDAEGNGSCEGAVDRACRRRRWGVHGGKGIGLAGEMVSDEVQDLVHLFAYHRRETEERRDTEMSKRLE